MKTSKSASWIGLGLFIFFLTACGSAPAQSTSTALATQFITLTATSTAIPKPTKAVPTLTISPIIAAGLLTPVAATVAADPLALNEFNAGTEMKRINIYGTGKLQDITFSPDGRYLAAATGRGIYLYDGKTFDQVGFLDVNDSVDAIAFSPDGLIISAAINGKVSLWSTLSGQKLSTLDGELVSIWTLAYGKGEYVAALGSTCSGCGFPQIGIILWSAKTGKQIYSQKDIGHSTTSLAFTSDGKRLAFGGGGLDIIDTETGKLVDVYTSGGDVVSEAIDTSLNFIFSTDDSLLFVNSNEVESNQILEVATGQRRVFSLCNSSFIRADSIGACFSKDKAILFDLSNGQKISELNTPGTSDDLSNRAALSPDGKDFLYQTGETVHVLEIQTGNEIKRLVFNTFDNVQTGMIFFNGKQENAAALENESGQVDLINVETGELLQTYSLPNSKIRGFAFRPGGRIVATLADEETLTLWDIQSQRIIYQTTLAEYVESPFVFSPDGVSAFFKNPDGEVLSFDFLRPATLDSNGGNSYGYSYADNFVQNNYHFNKAGNLVLFNIANNFPEFRDVKTDQKITLPVEVASATQYMEIEAFTTSADEKFLAFGSTTGIYAWNLETMKQIATLSGHTAHGGDGWYGMIRAVFFSPQSNLLVSVGWDQTTRLWDINGGQELRRLSVCCSATFTADGRFLLTAGDGVLRVWGIPRRP